MSSTPDQLATKAALEKVKLEQIQSVWGARKQDPRRTGMSSEDEDEETYEEDVEEFENVTMAMPPSAEVPRSGRAGWLWIPIVALLVAGYPLSKSAPRWFEELKSKPKLECRQVQISAQDRRGNITRIQQACLPKEVWAKYSDLDDQEAATSAGIAYIRGEP